MGPATDMTHPCTYCSPCIPFRQALPFHQDGVWPIRVCEISTFVDKAAAAVVAVCCRCSCNCFINPTLGQPTVASTGCDFLAVGDAGSCKKGVTLARLPRDVAQRPLLCACWHHVPATHSNYATMHFASAAAVAIACAVGRCCCCSAGNMCLQCSVAVMRLEDGYRASSQP